MLRAQSRTRGSVKNKPAPLTSLDFWRCKQTSTSLLALQLAAAELFANCHQSDRALSFPEDMQPRGDVHHPNSEVARWRGIQPGGIPALENVGSARN